MRPASARVLEAVTGGVAGVGTTGVYSTTVKNKKDKPTTSDYVVSGASGA